MDRRTVSQTFVDTELDIKPPRVTIGYDGICDEPTEEWERHPRWNPNDWKPLAVAWLIVVVAVAGLWLGGK